LTTLLEIVPVIVDHHARDALIPQIEDCTLIPDHSVVKVLQTFALEVDQLATHTLHVTFVGIDL
jgi:hypothetical protein